MGASLLKIGLIGFFIAILGFASPVFAQGDFVEDQNTGSSNESGGDSTFDPFSDYSEFEEGSEEEADINFFHNGRFFSVGILGGYESFTDTLGQIYKPSFTYGLFISYFFDLRFAIQVAYILADHPIELVNASTTTKYLGKASIQHFAIDVKYYLNTQNVNRGLAALNPYILIGFSQYYRNTTFNAFQGFVRDSAFGLQAGVGIEIPIMRNKAFLGVQGLYNYIGFPDEGSPVVINGTATNVSPNGDAVSVVGIIGTNF
jgi:hypothetical protein